MRVVIVGAGVVGMTTAWRLAQDGHEVTVLERHQGPGEETSFANGGQLSYSYVAPLAGPGVMGKVPGWLLRRDSPMRFRPVADPAQWRWLAAFMRACNAGTSEATTRKLLRLGFYSRDQLQAFVAQHEHEDSGFGFDFARRGKLVVHRDEAAFASACRLLRLRRQSWRRRPKPTGCTPPSWRRRPSSRPPPWRGRGRGGLRASSPSPRSGSC